MSPPTLVVCSSNQIMGSEESLLTYLRKRRAAGDSNYVFIVNEGSGELASCLQKAGSTVYRVQLGLSIRTDPHLFITSIQTLHNIAARLGARLCYGNNSELLPLLTGLRLRSLFTMKTVQHIRDIPWQPKWRALPQILVQSKVIFNSAWARQQWVPKVAFFLCGNRFVTVHNGVDYQYAQQQAFLHSKHQHSKSSGLVLSMFGRIRTDSGICFVLEALSKSPSLLRSVAEVRLIGAGRAVEASCDHSINNLLGANPLLSQRVVFVPWTTDKWKFLHESDIVICARRDETFGRVLIEAGALGKCVLASSGGGHSELLKDGENGSLWRPGDTADFLGRLEQLAASSDYRRRLGMSWKAEVESRFGADGYANSLNTAMQQALGR